MFTLSKRVEKLSFVLSLVTRGGNDSLYTFPSSHLNIPNLTFNMRFITCLCFNYVGPTGELLQYFLCNCPLLERLSVSNSNVVSLEVANSVLQLKHLEILLCLSLNFVEICAPNLTSLKYVGQIESLHLGNMPKLDDLYINACHNEETFSIFSRYYHQLESLKVKTMLLAQGNEDFFHLCLPNLKHLTLSLDANYDDSFLGWVTLLKACPLLQKFIVEVKQDQLKYDNSC